ncbi:MAG: amylo-alpha-1,6-glucosidase [Nostoc sp. ChiSLP02]|nr:amylo-alpha-1,6-glucosidase [Nostoc sp. DedSLP05]MDZ8097790.1 amylo-alpha-1,6-glucosidase [Nostoc sp. DedSLP01]MDZ8183875.1 amylo-alpha-1,6-glucosidase [Nostoc sp. ChiSLP02]
MSINFGREICGNLDAAESREWLVTNGRGSYASGTVAGLSTRGYHGLLVAALQPPLQRTLLLAKLDETAEYEGSSYPLFANRWSNGTVAPQGYRNIESFYLEGTVPVWNFACGGALLEKRIWMQPGADTTYIHYYLRRAKRSLKLSIKAFVNYRDYHSRTHANEWPAKDWRMNVAAIERGVAVTVYPGAQTLYLLTDSGNASLNNEWYFGFELAAEKERGLNDIDDHLYPATFTVTLEPGSSFTFVASTQQNPDLNGAAALDLRHQYEQKLIADWQAKRSPQAPPPPDWVQQLVLAADQFIVDRQGGKTIIAGYHWFTDWGRDTMISLPGLTLSTNRPQIADLILRTFGEYISKGMLPNHFPDNNQPLVDADYNTVDATLWYFEAIRIYLATTGDEKLLADLFPKLADIIEFHRQGTRYNIRLDPNDGLLYAGQAGVQLTWMDAKVGDWVVTPRIGKPVEVNALWYNALRTMSKFAHKLGKPYQDYDAMADTAQKGFSRFWNNAKGYCFDVLDSPSGNDASMRPNQIFAVSLPESPLTAEQQRQVVEACERSLLTSHGLRSLAPDDPQYIGNYSGDQFHRDSAYHQGTVWEWLIGPFVLAHLRVFNNPSVARQYLEPMQHHLYTAGVGTISEISNGNAPMEPKGCIAQAWSVGEVLRAWLATER